MFRLVIYKNQIEYLNQPLVDGQVYRIGRGDGCEIYLDEKIGISRQHATLQFSNGKWIVTRDSEHGTLFSLETNVERLELQDQDRFKIENFEFHFIKDQPTVENLEDVPQINQGQQDQEDRTQIFHLDQMATLRVRNEYIHFEKVYQLDGKRWFIGRDSSCQIQIEDAKLSRKHFELMQDKGQFFVRDLKSANGTSLNGVEVGTDWHPISSGDAIKIQKWQFDFEIQDSKFSEKISQASVLPIEFIPEEPPLFADQPTPESFAVHQIPDPTYENRTLGSHFKQQMNPVRLAIVVLLLGGLGFYLFPANEPAKPQSANLQKSPFDELSPAQQKYVRETYALADSLFKRGNYELARQEVVKIHELIPAYEESKNIEQLADVAIQTQLEQKKVEQRENEKRAIESQVLAQVQLCDSQLDESTTIQQSEICIQPVLALNPEHPSIKAYQTRVQTMLAERVARQEREAHRAAAIQQLRSLYQKAEEIKKSGRLLDAIEAYQKVVDLPRPDPANLKEKSRREMASIQTDLQEKQLVYQQEAEAHISRNDYKNAVLSLKRAVAINPNNESIKGRVVHLLGELRKQMQTLYQEGVLEESVGEVESAKIKWKRIIEMSLPEEEYYKKSQMKLKKYGAI